MKNKIVLKNVDFSYDEKKILNNFSLDIKEGEFLAILGQNGSGKSTIARMLNGLILPENGDILVDNLNTKNQDTIFDIRKEVAMVFQNPDNQLVTTVVEEDVAFGVENLGIERNEIKKRVYQALELLDMIEFKKADTSKLSGGQKQRVAIAGVLAMKPSVIIFDEPTSMLDPKGRQEVINAMIKLNKEGYTIILITHFMNEAMLADRIVVINSGKIDKIGNREEIFCDFELLQRNNLRMPETLEIMYKLKQKGLNIDIKLLSIKELGDLLCQLKLKI